MENEHEGQRPLRQEWPLSDPERWQRVSPKYAWVDLFANIMIALVAGGFMLVALAVSGFDAPLATFVAIPAVTLALLVNALLAFRRVRAIGYVLRTDDLLFRKGLLIQRTVSVPYGRLQLVDVTRGPLLRLFGLTTLEFVTAAESTGVKLPGLPVAEAESLRDQLISLAETRRSGL